MITNTRNWIIHYHYIQILFLSFRIHWCAENTDLVVIAEISLTPDRLFYLRPYVHKDMR